ncbi:MAG TPA: hypothetical protein VI408_11920, partial [Gaiellaceae bacterium]
AGWAASASAFVVLFAALPGTDLDRVSAGFTGATLVLLIALASQLVRLTAPRAEGRPPDAAAAVTPRS